MNDAEKCKAARALLVEAFCLLGKTAHHAEDCVLGPFVRKNQHCPPSHPVWKRAPACSCVLGKIGQFIREN